MKITNNSLQIQAAAFPVIILESAVPKVCSNEITASTFWAEITNLVPGQPIEKLITAAVTGNTGKSRFISPPFDLQHIRSSVSSLGDGDLLIAGPKTPHDILVAIAQSLQNGAAWFLHPDTPVETIEEIASTMSNGARLALHPRMASHKIRTGIAALNLETTLLLHPSSSDNELLVLLNALNENSRFTVLNPPASPVEMLFRAMAIQLSELDALPLDNPVVSPDISTDTSLENSKIHLSDISKLNEWAKSRHFEYLHTRPANNEYANIEQQLFLHQVALLGTQGHNTGVFTSKEIGKGTFLGEYLGERRTFDKEKNLDYVFKLGDDSEQCIDATQKRNWTAMVNSSSSADTANVTSCIIKNHIYYKAIANIQPDQQLLIYYDDDYTFESNVHRFLKPDDTWLDSNDMLTLYANLYQPEIKTLDDERFISTVFKLSPGTLFNVPVLNQKAGKPDLPLLAIHPETMQAEPQSRQENITLLMMHCWNGSLVNAKKLLKHGANPNIQTSISGVSALHVVIAAPYSIELKTSLIECLLQHGAILTLQDKLNRSVLHLATEYQDLDLIKYLCAIDAKKCLRNLIDNDDHDVFDLAQQYKSRRIMNYLRKWIGEDQPDPDASVSANKVTGTGQTFFSPTADIPNKRRKGHHMRTDESSKPALSVRKMG